jgi:hypothetical protein
MQSSLDLLSNAFDLRALAKYKNKNSEYQAAVVQNKEIAERIVQRMIDFTKETEEAEEPAVEVAPKPRLGLKELAKNIMSAPGRGFRRAIEGLKSYYRRSVDAAAGRPAAVEEEEEAFAPEQMKKFEDFLKLIRNTKKRSHVTKQLKRIREANKPSGAAEGAADVATAGNQDILKQSKLEI